MWHEQHLQQSMIPGIIAYDQRVNALVGFFSGKFGSANGLGLAVAQIYKQMKDQARMQGYQDVYMELSWASIVLIVLAFLLSKAKPGDGGGGGGGMH